MVEDCEQSLKFASAGGSNYCRFLDANGLCYKAKTAQVRAFFFYHNMYGLPSIYGSMMPVSKILSSCHFLSL